MGKIIASRIDIEDYYGMAMDTIELNGLIEIDAEEFTVRVNGFSYAGCDDCEDEDGAVIRIQYDHEDSRGEDEEIDLATLQMVEVILDYAEESINEGDLYEDIHSALELVM
jgi:hypothetical protein